MNAMLPIPVGARVGILTGVQTDAPTVTYHGTVQRHVEFWTGMPEYVVLVDGGGEFVYRPYLVVAA
jgi:hypothetical protein